MKNAFFKSLTGVTATMLLASYAGAQIANPEVEPNESKATATLANSGGAGMVAGDTITGTTTGTSTTVAGDASADYFRVRMAAAPLAIYRHELTIAGTPWVISMRGLGQTGSSAAGGTINTTSDTEHIAGAAVSGNELLSWYGFGKQEELYVRVTGATTTTAAYTLTLATEGVTPIDIAGTIVDGTITIRPPSTNTSDLDWWLYDANLNAVAGVGRDSGSPLGHATTTLAPGTYYVAWARWQAANNQASPIGETFFDDVLDFPNLISSGAATTTVPQGIEIVSTAGTVSATAPTVTKRGEIVWYRFTVLPNTIPTNPIVAGVNASGVLGQGALLRANVTPGQNPTSTGIAVTADLSTVGGSSTQALFDDGTNGDVTPGDGTFSYLYTIPGATPLGSYPIALTATDAETRTGTGSLTLSVDDFSNAIANAGTFTGSSATGSIGFANDIDLFRVYVCDPATFSATVATGGGTLSDSQMFMFREDGTGVAFNDDQAASALSSISGPLMAALTPGAYYIAVGDYNTDALSAGGLIWANTPFTGVRSPDGPGAAGALTGWDTGGGDTGTYTIAITGGGGEACAPTCPGNECGGQDFNGDGDFGTDQDIEAFFACLGGNCCATCFCQGSDFNGDGDFGTDADIEAFFRVLGGGNC